MNPEALKGPVEKVESCDFKPEVASFTSQLSREDTNELYLIFKKGLKTCDS